MKNNSQKKKRVLFYMDTLGNGGLDKMVVEIVNHLNFDKYDITVQTRFPGGYYGKFLDGRIKRKSNMLLPGTCSETYNHLVRVLCDKIHRKLMYKLFIHKKYDIEIACDDAFSTRLIGGSWNKKSKKILWEQMDVSANISTATNFNERQIYEFFKPFDKVICVSKNCAENFVKKNGFADITSYIYNPVDSDEINMKAEQFNVEDEKDTFSILAVGGLTPAKGYDRMMRVVKRLVEDGINFRLNIIGEGRERSKIENLISEYRISEYVNLLGFKTNPYPYMKNTDLFICCSKHESWCLALAESLLLNTPVLSTKCTGPVELLNNGEFGTLVENSEEGIYEGIKQLVYDKDKMKCCKEKAERYVNNYKVEDCIKQWEKLFDEE